MVEGSSGRDQDEMGGQRVGRRGGQARDVVDGSPRHDTHYPGHTPPHPSSVVTTPNRNGETSSQTLMKRSPCAPGPAEPAFDLWLDDLLADFAVSPPPPHPSDLQTDCFVNRDRHDGVSFTPWAWSLGCAVRVC